MNHRLVSWGFPFIILLQFHYAYSLFNYKKLGILPGNRGDSNLDCMMYHIMHGCLLHPTQHINLYNKIGTFYTIIC